MMKDQDVLEFHDFKQSILLKMIRIYQETYTDCDSDRCVVEAYNIRLTKQEIDDFIQEDHKISSQVLIFFLNYIIKYSKITNKIPPYFVLLSTDDNNPSINSIMMTNIKQIDQISLSKFKDLGNSQNAPIVIIIKCKTKWNMIILELQPWIIDFKCDQYTSFPNLESFASEFILNTFGLQIKNFNDYIVDYEQPGDAADLILYALYKIFILNLNLMSDTILTKNDYTTAKRKLLWLALSHMRERTKEDDDAEFTRRVIQKQKEEYQKQLEEEEQRKKELKNELGEKKKQIYGFLYTIEEPKKEIKQIDTPEQALLKMQLAKFNVTRPRNKAEAYLTRMRVREDFQFVYPETPKYEFPQKDPKAKVKNFVYEVQIPNKKPEIMQMITPASYCISEMFSGNINMPVPKLQKVYDYELLEQLEKQKKEREQILKKNQSCGGFLVGIGNRLFDRNDYSNGVIFERKKQEKEIKQKKVDEIQRNIDRLENELFSNYKQ